MLLKKLLKKIGLNLQEEKIDQDYNTEIISSLKSINDENIKKKVLTYLKKKDITEDNEIYKKLEVILSKKGLSPNLIELIFLYTTALYQEDELLEYLKFPTLKLTTKCGNLKTQIKEIGFTNNFVEKIFTIKPTEGGKGIGYGEVPLILFFGGEKVKTGDININNQLIEVKGNGGRFSNGKGKGREGNISFIYQELQTKYPDIEYKTNLSEYIHLIQTRYPESEQDINKLLNNIYPNSDNYNITKDSTSKDLLIKYIISYINTYPPQLYMLISNSGDYKLYNNEELINAVKNGDINFNNITPSSSYPQLKLT